MADKEIQHQNDSLRKDRTSNKDIQHGFTVRALIRDISKPTALALQQAGAELAAGDFKDRTSIDRALQGASGVFSVQVFTDGLEAEIRE